MLRFMGVVLAISCAIHASETTAVPPRTMVGLTLGGSHIFYDLEASYKPTDTHGLTALFSYQNFQGLDVFYGLQYDYFPFQGAFAVSPGFSIWDLHYGYSALVPNIGVVYEKSLGRNWVFKLRPFVGYQSRKEFLFPSIGLTLSRVF